MSVAAALVLRRGDGARLRALARSSTAAAAHVQRARMVLLAAQGLSNAEVGRRVGMTRQTVIAWRARYQAGGIDALADLPRPGRPPVIDESAVIVSTLNPPPRELAVTHWSARLLADHLSSTGMPVSFAEVARIWRDWGLRPHRVETFGFATDPRLAAKIRDVVGLYLDPPANAVVVRVEDRPPTRAPAGTAPVPSTRVGQAEGRAHDRRHGATTLVAALEVATGRAAAEAGFDQHPNGAFLMFLKQVAQAHPRAELHVVADNDATHKHPTVGAWLAGHPRITMHRTLTGASWTNLVEIFFGIVTHRTIRRGTCTGVGNLTAAIRAFADAHNQRYEPFRWIKIADQILTKPTAKRT